MTLSRRQFCAAVGATSVASTSTSLLARHTISGQQPAPLRVIAYNVFGCTGWPKERRLARQAVSQSQMAERLAAELALHKPDIVNFSESPAESITKQVAKLLGMNHVRFPSGGNWPGTILSRYEIAESQNAPIVDGQRPKELFTRHWGRARIQLANDNPLIVHSAHLFPGADPKIRLEEIKTMLASMKPDLEAGRSMLLIGDLNHAPDTAEHQLWIDAGWMDTFEKVGTGNGFTIRSDIPKWRIDYVLATGPIAGDVVESRPLFEGAFRLNINDKQSFALSDHVPQLAVFESTR